MDFILKIKADGTVQAGAELDKLASKVNRAWGERQQAAVARWQRDMADSARRRRQEAFQQLSAEEKLTRLTERRAAIERRLDAAMASGRTVRIEAMRAQLARTSAAMAQVGPVGFWGNLKQSMGMGGFAGGLTGGALGGFAGTMIATELAALPRKLMSVMHNAIMSGKAMADHIEDTAEAFGVSKLEAEKMNQIIREAGASENTIWNAISRVDSIRAAAKTDKVKAALLEKYGVGPEMLGPGVSAIDVATQIRRSIGSGGIQPEDRHALQEMGIQFPDKFMAVMAARLQRTWTAQEEARISMITDVAARAARRTEAAQAEKGRSAMETVASQEIVKGLYRQGGIRGPAAALGTMAVVGIYGALKGEAKAAAAEFGTAAAQTLAQTLGPRTVGAAPSQMRFGPKTFTETMPGVDSLRRIGLFVGAGQMTYERIYNQQLHELEGIRREVASLRRDVNREPIPQ